MPTATLHESAARAIAKERLACWADFCLKQRGVNGDTAAICSRVELPLIDRPKEGQIAAHFTGGKQMSCTLLLTGFGDSEPHGMASYDNGSIGSIRRGYCLFIPMFDEIKWTPDAWPTSLGELNALVSHVTNDPSQLETWLMKRGESNQLRIVVLIHCDVCYGYLVGPPTPAGISALRVVPIFFDRLVASWALAREQHLEVFQRRRSLRALVIGCGPLGSMVTEQLALAGVGCIDIVDKEGVDAAYCARQNLGADSIDLGKAHAVANRMQRLAPTTQVNAHRANAESWVPTHCRPGLYDVVIDLTAEASVRSTLVQHRSLSFAGTPILHGWAEPFCAAIHLIHLAADSDYPVEEPAHGVDIAQWPTEMLVQLASGGLGFHRYGSANVAQAAGFIAERCLAVIDAAVCDSLVWSWVRSEGFFNNLGVGSVRSLYVPKTANIFDSVHITRSFHDIFGAS